MKTPPKLTALAALLTSSLLTACGTAGVATVTDTSCRSFKPISMSKLDTTETKRQIVGHNRAFEAVCGEGAPQRVATNG
jgi:hypothetical protein